MVGIDGETRTGFPPGWEESSWGGIIQQQQQQTAVEDSPTGTFDASTISRSKTLDSVIGLHETPPDLPLISAPHLGGDDVASEGGYINPAAKGLGQLFEQVNKDGDAIFLNYVNTQLSPEARSGVLREMHQQVQEPSSTDSLLLTQVAQLFSQSTNGLVSNLSNGSGGLGADLGGLTERDKDYLSQMDDFDNSALNRSEDTSPEAFRFAGNFLHIITRLMAFVNQMKALIASIDSDQIRRLGEAENDNTKALIELSKERLEKSIEQRELMRNQSDIGKWIIFGITAVASIALTVVTAGKSMLLMAIILATTLTTLTMQALEMAGVSVTKAILEAFGADPEKYDWLLKFVIALVMIVGSLAAAGGAFLANAGGLATQFTAKQVIGTVAINVVPAQLMASNVVFEVAVRIGKEMGMSEEDAAYFAMAMTLIVMIVVIIVTMLAAPKVSLEMTDDVAKAAGEGSKTGVKTQAQNAAKSMKKMGNKAANAAKATKKAFEEGRLLEFLGKNIAAAGKRISQMAEEIAENVLELGAKAVDTAVDKMDEAIGVMRSSVERSINILRRSAKLVAKRAKELSRNAADEVKDAASLIEQRANNLLAKAGISRGSPEIAKADDTIAITDTADDVSKNLESSSDTASKAAEADNVEGDSVEGDLVEGEKAEIDSGGTGQGQSGNSRGDGPEVNRSVEDGDDLGVDPLRKKSKNPLKNFKETWENMSAEERIHLVERFAAVVEAAGSVAGAVASIKQAILTEMRAELQYDIAVLDALRDLLETLNAMFGETRQGILHDLENGIFKFSTDLHKFFEQLVSGLSSQMSQMNRSLK